MLTHMSLFSGIGGIDLAAEWAGFETVGQCEWADYPTRVLEKHWPNVPRWKDVRTVTKESVVNRIGLQSIDLISGGFPCQPFSTASHGHKTAIDLSGEFLRVIREIRPRYAIGENVDKGIIEQVAEQCRSYGYRAIAIGSSANEYGADHIRNRWWAIAYPDNQSQFPSVLNAKVAELQTVSGHPWTAENFARVFRVSDGISNRVDRFKCLGNAVVPQQVYPILRAIADIETAQ